MVFGFDFQYLAEAGTPDGDEFTLRLVGILGDISALRCETVQSTGHVTTTNCMSSSASPTATSRRTWRSCPSEVESETRPTICTPGTDHAPNSRLALSKHSEPTAPTVAPAKLRRASFLPLLPVSRHRPQALLRRAHDISTDGRVGVSCLGLTRKWAVGCHLVEIHWRS